MKKNKLNGAKKSGMQDNEKRNLKNCKNES